MIIGVTYVKLSLFCTNIWWNSKDNIIAFIFLHSQFLEGGSAKFTLLMCISLLKKSNISVQYHLDFKFYEFIYIKPCWQLKPMFGSNRKRFVNEIINCCYQGKGKQSWVWMKKNSISGRWYTLQQFQNFTFEDWDPHNYPTFLLK